MNQRNIVTCLTNMAQLAAQLEIAAHRAKDTEKEEIPIKYEWLVFATGAMRNDIEYLTRELFPKPWWQRLCCLF